MTERPAHWDAVYAAREEQALTWHEDDPRLSLDLIRRYGPPDGAVIDVGGGASRLAERLLQSGRGPVTVLDVSAAALAASRARLGAAAAGATWIEADVTAWTPDRSYAVWHDRAVFHFLTGQADRAAYVTAMDRSLADGGIAIIATFDADGPETCSGLPVMRYAPDDLAHTLDVLAPGRFRRLDARRHVHVTPKGNRQAFQTSVFRKRTG